jgi:phage-related holin
MLVKDLRPGDLLTSTSYYNRSIRLVTVISVCSKVDRIFHNVSVIENNRICSYYMQSSLAITNYYFDVVK